MLNIMRSLEIIFVAMLFVSTSHVFDVALGERTSAKSEMDYEWEAILKHVQKYMAEQNEFATSQDGWLEIYKRKQERKQIREKSCPSLSYEEIKENTLRSPRAKLFTGADKTGNVEVYEFQSPTWIGGCYALKKYKGQIKSVDTEGKCVRLFSDFLCQGWSQSIYPGSTIIPDGKLKGVESIGPCVSNEFKHPAIIKSSPPQLEKLASALESFANVPDLIADAETRHEAFTDVDTSSNPVLKYLLGTQNRVEALTSRIYQRHLKSREAAENARVAGLKQSFYSKLELEESDEPGFGIPLELGGPADGIYNVYPQNRKQGVIFKGKIVPLVTQWLKDKPGSYVMLNVNFVYKNFSTTRPSGIWYWGHLIDRDFRRLEIFYGYIPNSE